MLPTRTTVTAIVLIAAALAPVPAHAIFHLWYIKEAFSNHDGSVQFIELYTDSGGQEFLAGQTLTSKSNTFNFTNSPAPTNGRHLLLATAGFGSIPGGATPNYIIPSNFFNPETDTLTFAEFYDQKSFELAPIDGVMSLNFSGPFSAATVATNSPRNFAGQGSSVNLAPTTSPTGDYNGNLVVDAGDYVVWRETLTQSANPAGSGADGNESGTIDPGDFDYWTAKFGNAVPAAAQGAQTGLVPEPGAAVLILAVLGLLRLRRVRSPY